MLFAKIKAIALKPSVLAVGFVSGLYLLSKIMGFARNFVILKNMGKVSSDMFYKADLIPSQLSAILLMGTIVSSVLPIASRLMNKDKETKLEDYTRTYNYFNLISAIILISLFALILISQIFLEPLLQRVTSEESYQFYLTNGLLDEYTLNARILLLTPFNFAIQALFGILLNLKKRFNIFAFAGVITNVGSISGAILATTTNIVPLPIGMLLGGFVTSLLYIYYAIKDGYLLPDFFNKNYWVSLFNSYKVELKDTAKVFLPRILLLDGFLVSSFALAKLAEAESGALTAFDVATSIQGAFYILISSIGIILFPDISKIVNDKSIGIKEFWDRIYKYLKVTMGLGLFVSIITIPGSFLVIKFFEQFGKLQGVEQNQYIILLTSISAFRLFYMGIKEVLDKVFYARESKVLPIALSIVANLVQLSFIFGMVFWSGYQDVGVIVSIGLLLYYMVWVILALFRVRKEVSGQ
jgi:putative peptidoglycan lipid II flippase